MLKYTQITTLIAKLLYKHDCVIVPNFGGFVARNYTASFNKGNNLLSPPTKQILFNKNLLHNDGLLESALMEENNILFEEAQKIVVDYKEYIQSLLSAKKRFELGNIGLLYIDAENSLRFEAKADVNFLLDSFGFEPLRANQLVIEAETPLFTKQFNDRRVTIDVPKKQKQSYVRIATLSILVPAILAFLLFAAYSKPMQPLLQSSFNPFYTPQKTYVPYKQRHKSYIIKPFEKQMLVADANGFATLQLTENGPVLIAMANDSIAKIDKTLVSKPVLHSKTSKPFSGKFQIVMGCFGVEKNANNLIADLKQKHIEAGISGLNASGLHIVSCGGFNTKQEAVTVLASVKALYPNAWIMAK
jgi:hypothetical protein